MPGWIGSRTKSAFCVLLEKFYGVADGQNRFRGVVGNFAIEFFFERHDELDRVEAVGAEILDETGVFRDLVGVDAEIVHDDLFHPLGNITHRSNLMFQRDSLGLSLRLFVGDGRGSTPIRGGSWLPRSPASQVPRARFRSGYHTSPGLASASEPHRPAIPRLYIIAIPPLTCSVCPVT